MISSRGYVFWHDYGGRGSFEPLTKYLESLPIEIYRVPATSLAWTTAAELKKLAPKFRPKGERPEQETVRAQAV
jgi:hypothetical protein